MKKSNLILITLMVVAAGFFVGAWIWSNSQTLPAPPDSPSGESATSTTSSALEPKASSDGWAEVEVKPLALGSKEWSFSVTLNAHQEIDADLMKAATLADSQGDTFAPLRWEEPTPGGHHREGTLVFGAPASKPQNMTLTLKDVGGAAVRTFSWQLP